MKLLMAFVVLTQFKKMMLSLPSFVPSVEQSVFLVIAVVFLECVPTQREIRIASAPL